MQLSCLSLCLLALLFKNLSMNYCEIFGRVRLVIAEQSSIVFYFMGDCHLPVASSLYFVHIHLVAVYWGYALFECCLVPRIVFLLCLYL